MGRRPPPFVAAPSLSRTARGLRTAPLVRHLAAWLPAVRALRAGLLASRARSARIGGATRSRLFPSLGCRLAALASDPLTALGGKVPLSVLVTPVSDLALPLRLARAGHVVWALDPRRDRVRRGVRAADRESFTLRFTAGSPQTVLPRSESIDVVVAPRLLTGGSVEPHSAFEACVSVLRPGGWLVLVESARPERPWWRSWLGARRPRPGRLFADGLRPDEAMTYLRLSELSWVASCAGDDEPDHPGLARHRGEYVVWGRKPDSPRTSGG